MKKRLSWVDNTKALGMLLVFWGHLLEKGFFGPALIHGVYKGIYAFHMPMFFLLAGLFLVPAGGRFIGWILLDKIKTRLVPVLFFVALVIPIWLWPKPAAWGIASDPDVLQGLRNLLDGKPIANWTCWFLVCLMVVEIIASQLGMVVRRRWLLLAVLPLVYASGMYVTGNLASVAALLKVAPNWWFLQESVVCLFFYLCGYGLFHYIPVLLPSGSAKKSLVGVIIFFAVLLATYNRNYADGLATVNLSGGDHGDWLWFGISALAGSLALIHLGQLMSVSPLLAAIGRNTLPLLGINGIFLHFLNAPLWALAVSLTGNPFFLLAISFLMALASLLLSLPLAMFFSRWLPYLVGGWKPSR